MAQNLATIFYIVIVTDKTSSPPSDSNHIPLAPLLIASTLPTPPSFIIISNLNQLLVLSPLMDPPIEELATNSSNNPLIVAPPSQGMTARYAALSPSQLLVGKVVMLCSPIKSTKSSHLNKSLANS